MSEITCGTCLWWKYGDAANGQCRRHAPLPVLFYAATLPGEPMPWARWPLTMADDACGEWQPPPVKQVKEVA